MSNSTVWKGVRCDDICVSCLVESFVKFSVEGFDLILVDNCI